MSTTKEVSKGETSEGEEIASKASPKKPDVEVGADTDIRRRVVEVFAQLEEFCSEPAFTSPINEFFRRESEVYF